MLTAAKRLVATASIKADHEAVAAHYEQEAWVFAEKAKEMREMAEAYDTYPYSVGPIPEAQDSLVSQVHCKSLASAYESIAKENEELARLHRQIAAGLK